MTPQRTAVRALKWSLLGEVASRFVGPVVFLVLARLLLPEDFGVVAAATVAVSLSQVFFDSGLSRALVQRQAEDRAAADAAVWLNLAISIVLMAVLLLSAPTVAAFFKDARISGVVRVLALQLPIVAVCSVATALMQKRLDFERLFWVRLATTGAPGIASIPLALLGLSYWALVIGTLVGQILQLVVLSWLLGWRLTLTLDIRVARQLLSFAKWSLASGLLGWLFGWLDTIVVGHYLGSRDMGLYRTGNTLVIAIFGLAFAPLLPVLYSLFSRQQTDLARLRSGLLTVTHAIALVALPLGFTLFTIRTDLADLALGPQWLGADAVIGLLALSHAVGWLSGVNGELYRAIGKPHVETIAMVIMLVVSVPTYLVYVGHGLHAFLLARVTLSLVAFVLHVVVCWRVIGIAPSHWLRCCLWATLSAVAATLIMRWVSVGYDHAVVRSAMMLAVGGATYAAIILVLERDFVRRLAHVLVPASVASKCKTDRG